MATHRILAFPLKKLAFNFHSPAKSLTHYKTITRTKFRIDIKIESRIK